MPGLPLTVVAPADLRRRFALASAAEPLSALSPAASAELEAILSAARDFEDLPGKWQAALARAEATLCGAPAAAAGSCCAGALASE